MNELKEKEAQELSKEEINVYAAGCGEIQNHCKNDCFGGGSFLNPISVMEEKRIEVTENEELLKEEVDIYELPDCDIVRKKCENDCIGGGAFLNTTK